MNNKKIKILYYEPNESTIKNYEGQTYEGIFEEKRERLEKEYLVALRKRPIDMTKRIINLLETEYIFDYLIIYNLNPPMKIFDDADSFANAITNYTYFYMVNNELKKLEKNLLPKKIGATVKMGNLTNNPFASLREVNQIANFSLENLSYVWLSSDYDGKERLLVYTTNDKLKFPTYKEYKLQKEDEMFSEKLEKLRIEYSHQAGYDISKDYLKSVFRKLNHDIVFPPVEFIAEKSELNVNVIKTFAYNYDAIFQKNEFEKELYIQAEKTFTDKYKYVFVENLSGIYTKVGSKFTDSDGNVEVVDADFNIATNAAIIKKETFVSASMLDNLKMQKEIRKELAGKIPMSNSKVIFYFPAKEDISSNVKMYNGSSVENLYKNIKNSDNKEIETSKDTNAIEGPRKKFYLKIQYVDENGKAIINPTMKEMINSREYSLDEFEYIIDGDGNTWKCRESYKNGSIDLENLIDGTLTLTYGIVKPILKLICDTIYGEKLKEELVMTFANEVYVAKDLPNLRDENGLLWKAQDNIESSIYVEEGKINELIITYEEAKQKIYIQYEDEENEKIGEDKVILEQVGKNFRVPLENHYEDSNGCWWKMKEYSRLSFIVSENEEYNKVAISYIPDYTEVMIIYQDLRGEEIRNKETMKIQIGKKVDDVLKRTIKDRRGNIWNIVMDSYQSFVVKKDSNNEIIYKYDIAKSEVEIRYCNLSGELIKSTEKVYRQIGSGVVPSPELFMYDEERRKWRLQKIEPALLKVEEKDNVITYWYQKANAEINLLFVDIEGNEIQSSKKDKAQIGTSYVPSALEKVIYQSEQVWKLVNVEPKEIIVKEDSQENEVRFVYEKDKNVGEYDDFN